MLRPQLQKHKIMKKGGRKAGSSREDCKAETREADWKGEDVSDDEKRDYYKCRISKCDFGKNSVPMSRIVAMCTAA